jgi:hypothetical protein
LAFASCLQCFPFPSHLSSSNRRNTFAILHPVASTEPHLRLATAEGEAEREACRRRRVGEHSRTTPPASGRSGADGFRIGGGAGGASCGEKRSRRPAAVAGPLLRARRPWPMDTVDAPAARMEKWRRPWLPPASLPTGWPPLLPRQSRPAPPSPSPAVAPPLLLLGGRRPLFPTPTRWI